MTSPLVRVLRRIPLSRAILAGRAPGGIERSAVEGGTVWRPARASGLAIDRPLLVVTGRRGASLAWLAGSLAEELDAVVVVAASPVTDAVALQRLVESGASCGGSPQLVGLLGVGAGAADALAAAARPDSGVVRLALVGPTGLPAETAGRVPPMLLQCSRASAATSRTAELERTLRDRGVAIRATDYTGVDDAWAEFPRGAQGRRRALTDLVAFLRRGLGDQSTFRVIPGWDLS